ncbi:MAG: Flp pilus assembly protein CpaB [Eubacteriales bacterium]|nr:Flp pilus assembly protein CpaB [Eubacteriales bacterium]MDD4323452.1 Flp pilus assembly protein CpaB [Eubacteriales bacterium]MDD4540693.1 Flp pilus assembly protein CpaB [Eubacteriales bacterium]
MKQSRIIIIVLAIVLALITTFFLYRYIEDLRKEPEVTVVYNDVVVAAVNVPVNTEITAGMLRVESLPQEAIHANSSGDINDFLGYTTVMPITEGEQILKSKIALDDGRSALSYQIPENMRAVVVPTGEVSGLAGYLQIGDKVDLLVTYSGRSAQELEEPEPAESEPGEPEATEPEPVETEPGETEETAAEDLEPGEEEEAETLSYTITQFQNLEVLELGVSDYVNAEGNVVKAYGVPTSVTLLVSPEQAEVLVFMLNTGTFQMSLRNPTDDTIVPLDHFGDDNFTDWRNR